MNTIILTIIILTNWFNTNITSVNETEVAALNLKDTSRKDKIDSLKWIVYSINYYQTVQHYRNDSTPQISILECDIQFNGENKDREDTTIFYFSFFKNTIEDIYTPKNFYFSGIGYSHKNGNYFPMLNNAYPTFAQDIDTCNIFFKTREKKFIEYLREYKGQISSWLKSEIIRRQVLLKF